MKNLPKEITRSGGKIEIEKENETWEGKSLAILRHGLHSNCLKVQMLQEIILNSLKDISTGMLATAYMLA